jgi:hypothetical protein
VRAATFYFAIGRDYRFRDLTIALACGQRHFLLPTGSLAARRLRAIPGVHVALDSAAYPPNNPNASASPPTGRKSCHGGAIPATGAV